MGRPPSPSDPQLRWRNYRHQGQGGQCCAAPGGCALGHAAPPGGPALVVTDSRHHPGPASAAGVATPHLRQGPV